MVSRWERWPADSGHSVAEPSSTTGLSRRAAEGHKPIYRNRRKHVRPCGRLGLARFSGVVSKLRA